ncbi:hypothetical protein ACFUEM_02910 [Streptomyces anulatus]|uniref:hypothetical protein n=1 Tax=Streptomyces anulatus TaxID=1892 RepID=UPI0035D6FC60
MNLDRSTAARDSATPGELVEQAMRLVRQAEALLEQAVIAERARDTSWERIGRSLGGVTKSAAHKRFGAKATAYSLEIANGAFDVYDERDTSGVPEPINDFIDPFDVAYGELEDCWRMAAGVIHDQRELALLGNVRQAVQGRKEHVSGFVTVPLDADPLIRDEKAVGEDPADVDEYAAEGTPVQTDGGSPALVTHGEAGRKTHATYGNLPAEHFARELRRSLQKPAAWSREQPVLEDWTTLAADPTRMYRLAVQAKAWPPSEHESADARFEAIEARLEAIESAISSPRDE